MLRRLRFIGLVLAFGLVLSACTWPMYGFGPDHWGVNPVVSNLKRSNVGTLTLKGSGSTNAVGLGSSPALANGVLYVGSQDHKLYAFDQYGGSGTCSGSPKTCTPLWTAATGGVIGESSPAVANGVVYIGSADGKLYAFDAAGGSTTCSGSPKTCTPLWTGATGGAIQGSPTVVNGVVYVGSNDYKLYAFDAAGGSGRCSGTPKTCTPLWTAATGGVVTPSPAVAGGVVYVGSDDGTLYAFDAAGGSSTCSGTPKTCTPLWTAFVGYFTIARSAVVANGVVYVAAGPSNSVYAFDASGGSATCGGAPKTCKPLWNGLTGTGGLSPAVYNGVLYFPGADKLYAFDAAGGSATCSGSPKTCNPLWTGTVGSGSAPGIENGIVFVGSGNSVVAFDSAGSLNCSGSPKSCSPLWTSAATGRVVTATPVPGGDEVYVASADGNVYAFGLP